MSCIAQLPPHVADLIAAGEVVERPASVVKELVENAVDAGAHTVTVEIRNGGMALVRVTDDGCGIAPNETETAFLRHATSKIHSEYDLEAIGTLGFRGEALAAIAAVARVELTTRRPEDAFGALLTLEGGKLLGKEETGCPRGTTILVRDLFYNTPARLKFMKKDAAEGAACLACVQRQALAHPEVSFRFLRDGKQELLTPGDGQLYSALYAVLGRDMALGFQAVEGTGEDGISIHGFISLPVCCRGTRGYQFFFVNGRYIKSKLLTDAVEQAYANQKMVGKFPGCVLHLNLKHNAVDVNVHPTKEEVKFSRENTVFTAVYASVLSALDADHTRPQAVLSTTPHQEQAAPSVFLPLRSPSASAFTRPQPLPRSDPAPTPLKPSKHERRREAAQTGGCSSSGAYQGRTAASAIPRAAAPPPSTASPPLMESLSESPSEQEQISLWDEQDVPAWKIVGELFHTYIVVEQGEKALLIDKHAAHERMNFDRMRTGDYQPMSQELLVPAVFTPAPEEAQILLDHLSELEQLGFSVEDFGGGALTVRRAPDYVVPGEIASTLTEIAGRLAAVGSVGEAERRDALLHTMACKAATKGGWKNAPQELEQIVQAVMRGQVKYCPHGRPVAIELSQRQLEKQFKRTSS